MNLYRFEVKLDSGLVHVVIAAESEEQAFNQADIELESHFLKLPIVEDIVLYEKRIIRKGAGFVISRDESII